MISSGLNGSSSNFSTALASLISQILTQKLQLNTAYYAALFTVSLVTIGKVSNYFSNSDIINKSVVNLSFMIIVKSLGFLLLLFLFGCLVMWLIINYSKGGKSKYANHTCMNFYRNYIILQILLYLELKPQVCSDYFDIDFGDPLLEANSMIDQHCGNGHSRSKSQTGTLNSEIKFKDEDLDVKGYIKWCSTEQSTTIQQGKNIDNLESKPTKVNVKYLKIFAQSISEQKRLDPLKFINQIYEEIGKLTSNVVVYGRKDFIKNSHETLLLDMKKLSHKRMEEKYIKTFFHPQKRLIWNLCKKVHSDKEFFESLGQVPACNWILHGPPGTGKSTLPFRIAMSLGRHICSVDIKSIKNKRDAYQIFQNPVINGALRKPEDVVFVLDEFDMGIKHLAAKEKEKREVSKYMENHYSYNYGCEYSSPVMQKRSIPSSFMKKKLEAKKKSKIKAGKITKEEAKSEETSDALAEELFGDVDMEFCVKDLLEILQGCIPAKGMILFATTNHFEEIRNICPALFRHGRLTPVHFDYPSIQTVQEISQHFYNQELDFDIPKSHTISTAQIIGTITNLKLFEETSGFLSFRNAMQEIFYPTKNQSSIESSASEESSIEIFKQ